LSTSIILHHVQTLQFRIVPVWFPLRIESVHHILVSERFKARNRSSLVPVKIAYSETVPICFSDLFCDVSNFDVHTCRYGAVTSENGLSIVTLWQF